MKASKKNKSDDEYPSSYHHNTEKEEITLAYVENVRQQFELIFPKRAELFLSPLNECGIRKFVSTAICPTVLPFPELYELDGCIKFIADRIIFEPQQDIFKMPSVLTSPYTTLKKKKGNAFDISVLLCSLLI
ncbi:MAG: putative dynein regulatory complex subunit 7, partial [Streblomastix strix]